MLQEIGVERVELVYAARLASHAYFFVHCVSTQLGMTFLAPGEAVSEFARAGHFYPWEGKIIGEGHIKQAILR
jgi:hypothetical protein